MKKKQSNQHQKVKKFFDRIAPDYSTKYEVSYFLQYFFKERLKEATHHFSFEKKSILDVGAGTGALFHFLKKQKIDCDYFATDISSEMRAQSDIPQEQYFVGEINDFHFSDKKFDFIFLLGVTTYFSKPQFDLHLKFIQQRLTSDGVAIISFTNRSSFDFKLRSIARFFTRLLSLKKNVIGQSFEIFAYSPAETKKIVAHDFSIQKQTFLNQTFPPFNRIFPKTSVRFAKFLKKNIASKFLLSLMSSDFLLFLESKK